MLVSLVTRKTYQGFGFWVMGVFSLAIGAAMLIPGALPSHWLVRLSRNAFLVGGLMLIFHGLIVFRDVKISRQFEALFFLSFLAVFGYFSIDAAHLDARIATYSVYAALICFAAAYTTLKKRPAFFASSDVMLAIWLLIYALLTLVRMAQQLLNPENSTAFEALKGIGSFYAVAQILTVQLVTLTLISMNSQRIEWEYENNLVRVQESEENFRLVTETAHDAIVMLDSPGKVTVWNSAAERMFGLSRDQATGKTLAQLIAPPTQAATYTALASPQDDLDFAKGITIELPVRDSRGREFLVELSISRFLQRGAQRTVCIMRDISERKQQELVLQNLRGDLQATLDAVPDLLFELDLNGVYHAYHSPRTELLAVSPNQLIGNTIFEALPPDAASVCHAALQEANDKEFSDGKQLVIDLPIGRKWFELSVAKKQSAFGTVPHFVVISREVTQRMEAMEILRHHQAELERKVAERTDELLVAKTAAEAANISKSAFLANMSHEIRTPLNAITGMSQFIRKEGLTPTQTHRMDQLETASLHLLSIINDILDLSKIESGKLNLEEKPLRLDRLVSNVVTMVHDKAAAKKLNIKTEIEAMDGEFVGDTTRIQQALLNYASNAVKFTDEGAVTLRVLCMEETEQDALLRFEVSDDGIGISDSAQGRLFEAFEQADTSNTRQYGGTGLGLAITKKLAELMGGSAGLHSEVGHGSTFWFSVRLKKLDRPSDAPSDTHQNAQALIREQFSTLSVLIVEDEPVNREIGILYMEEVGLHVDTAEDGLQAVEMAKGKQYGLIFMDMRMPHMDGIEATRTIRKLPHYQDVPIIAMTANAFVEDRDQCLAAGMSDFITKPAQPMEVYAAMCRNLAR